MARKEEVYHVPLAALALLGYVRGEVDDVTEETRYTSHGLYEDMIIGIARQCDDVGGFDVKPSLFRRLALVDGLTASKIALRYCMNIRQAQRYMRKLKILEQAINDRLPWLAYGIQRTIP